MRLKDSIDDILAQTDSRLSESFYGRLFDEHPRLKDFFEGTNLHRQKHKLTMALQIVAQNHRHPNAAMSGFLKELGAIHRERGIAPQDFCKFRDTLLAAIESYHGRDASAELIAEWASALDRALELMSEGSGTSCGEGA